MTPQETTILVYMTIALGVIMGIGLLVILVKKIIEKIYPNECEVNITRKDGRNLIIKDRYKITKNKDARTGSEIPVYGIKTLKTKLHIQKADEDLFDVLSAKSDYCRITVLPSNEAYLWKPRFNNASKRIEFDIADRDALLWHVDAYKQLDELYAWKNKLGEFMQMAAPFIMIIIVVFGGYYITKMQKETGDQITQVSNNQVQILDRLSGILNSSVALQQAIYIKEFGLQQTNPPGVGG